MSADFTVVTVCNRLPQEPYYCFNEWYNSLRGVEPLIIQALGSHYQGLGDKPKFVYRAIALNLIKTKYIIFCDSWDLVFATKPQYLLDTALLQYKEPLVISAEKNCFPADHKEGYDKLNHPSTYKYLNSGMIVGETSALLAVLEAMDLGNVPDDYRKEDGNMHHVNDQELYQAIFLKQPVPIALDYKQAVCQTMHDVSLDELDFSQEYIINKETLCAPCAFHFNGGYINL